MKILKANGYPAANINASTIVGALSFIMVTKELMLNKQVYINGR